MSILAHLGIINRPGSSVPKNKRTILEGAAKKIEKEIIMPRTAQAISQAEAAGVSENLKAMSDPEKRRKAIAQEARRKLALLNRHKK